ncbi:hypothetical protein L3Q82_014556, partial [Scortum barcoo]
HAYALCRKGQSRLYFLRRLASFNICKKLLQIFLPVCGSERALLYAVVCWRGGSLKKKDAARLDKLVRKAGSVGTELDSLTSVAERRTLNRLLSIIDNPSHPLHSAISRQRSSFSDRQTVVTVLLHRQTEEIVPPPQLFNTLAAIPCNTLDSSVYKPTVAQLGRPVTKSNERWDQRCWGTGSSYNDPMRACLDALFLAQTEQVVTYSTMSLVTPGHQKCCLTINSVRLDPEWHVSSKV